VQFSSSNSSEVQFSSSNSSDQTEHTRKEELIKLLSRAHANVWPNWSRSEREKGNSCQHA